MHIYIYTFPQPTFAIARFPTAPRGPHDHVVSLTAWGVWRTAGVVLPATVVAAGALEWCLGSDQTIGRHGFSHT